MERGKRKPRPSCSPLSHSQILHTLKNRSTFKMCHLLFKDVHSCVFSPLGTIFFSSVKLQVINRTMSLYSLSFLPLGGELSDIACLLSTFLLVRLCFGKGSSPRTLCLQFIPTATRWWQCLFMVCRLVFMPGVGRKTQQKPSCVLTNYVHMYKIFMYYGIHLYDVLH